MIPGLNILSEALRLINPQTVKFFKTTNRTKTPAGLFVAAFAAGVDVAQGSLQAVPRTRYQVLGLELSKKYVTWFVPSVAVAGLERGTSGDQFEYNGERFQAESVTDWAGQDGWLEVLGVKIGAANA